MIRIDDRHWPLVVYHFSGEVTLPELEDYLARQDAMLKRKQMTGSLVLTENIKMWETRVLRRQAQWIKDNEADLRRYSVGAALILKSPIVRGMLKAILWIQPMPQPHMVTSSTEDALHWLRERFLASKISVELPTHV